MTREYVTRTAKCKRCGSETVTWQQGFNGNYYLTEVFSYDGIEKTDRKDFHSHYCGEPEKHEAEQNEIDSDYADAETAREEAVAKSAAKTAAYFLGLHDLCKAQPSEAVAKLAELERKVAYENRNWISMDTMTDAMRQRAEVSQMTAEIRFIGAALGCTGEWGGSAGWSHDGDTCPVHEH